MILADGIVIVGAILAVVLGIMIGFGRGLKLCTIGPSGILISIVFTYFLFGAVLKLPFIQNWLNQMMISLSENPSWICKVLVAIRIDLIVFAVALFLVIQILRKVLVNILVGIGDSNVIGIKVVNKILGAVLLLAAYLVLLTIVFQILYWIYGAGDTSAFYQSLKGGLLGLDGFYANNPLTGLVDTIIAVSRNAVGV